MSTFTPTNTATSNNTHPSSSSNSNNKRRSARVPKRDPIVAPGFGTQKDLENLASCLGLPTEAVHVSIIYIYINMGMTSCLSIAFVVKFTRFLF